MKATLNKKVSDFCLLATNNQTIQLNQFTDKNIILYFYPKDNTPGCTKESEAFRDSFSAFKKLNTVILGISRDSVASHEKFKIKYNLPFDLISDTDEILCTQYDVIKTKNRYGKQVRGIERSTFLISKTGQLVQEWRNVKVDGHVEEVLTAIKQYQSNE